MTSTPKSPGGIPRAVLFGLLAVVAIGIVLQVRESQPVGDAPELPVLTGTTEIAELVISTAGSGTSAPNLTRGDLVLAADGTL